MTTLNIEEIIKQKASEYSEKIIKIKREAVSEEDVRHEINKLIDDFVEIAKIEVKARHEYGLSGKRIDSKYGGVIIEYKNPKNANKIGKTLKSKSTISLVNQIKERFDDFSKDENKDPQKIFGVGCDANKILFVKYVGKKYVIEEPSNINQYSIERLLRALLSMGARGVSYTPDNLSLDFGSYSEVAGSFIKTLYQLLSKTQDSKTKALYEQWQILFGEICGYDKGKKIKEIDKLANLYNINGKYNLDSMIFVVHTYFALFMKMLSAEILSAFSPFGMSIVRKCINASSNYVLFDELKSLEDGGLWNKMGISNFLEGDLFSWYLCEWNDDVALAINKLVVKLDRYDPTTLSVDPHESRDLLKKLYHQLLPKKLRHDLGEYYTPDWLVEYTINKADYTGNPSHRVLDPTCGSGSFLVAYINKIKNWFSVNRYDCGFEEDTIIKMILHNVVGFDLNPIAVMASRTNYLIAVREYLKYVSKIEIPVYLCDAIVIPSKMGDILAQKTMLTQFKTPHDTSNPPLVVKTSVGPFNIAPEIASNSQVINGYANCLEYAVENNLTIDQFIEYCELKGITINEKRWHEELLKQLIDLKEANKNGIWARIIKNAFAPLFVDRFDFVIGNPPWVTYENLPANYRKDSEDIWKKYGLFPKGGWRARFAKGNTELAMVFTYSCVDHYLTDDGTLCFVITQSIFQSKEAGVGFRKFRIPLRYINIVVDSVEDLTIINPFEGAQNRTAIITCKKSKDKATKYPVKYVEWQKKERGAIDVDEEIGKVLGLTERITKGAFPIDDNRGPWMLLPEGLDKSTFYKIMSGKQHYRAWKGCDTRGGNGIFWLQAVSNDVSSYIVARNTLENSRKDNIPQLEWAFEKEIVFPLLRGKETSKWKIEPNLYLIYPHVEDEVIEEHILKVKYPKTYEYFVKLKRQLLERKHYDLSQKELLFYSLFETGNYLTSKYKVVWKEQAKSLTCAVVSQKDDIILGKKVIIPDHKLIVLPCNTLGEAHFVCGMLNCKIAELLASTYIVGTQISTHILDYIKVPPYNENNAQHSKVSRISKNCHKYALANAYDKINREEMELTKAAGAIWKLTDKEIKTISNSF